MNKRVLIVLGVLGFLGVLGILRVAPNAIFLKEGNAKRFSFSNNSIEKAVKREKELKMKIASSAFKTNGRIPAKYTCEGDDINPPLSISKVPEGTRSLVLIVDDPDAPMGTWDHWLVFNIDPMVREIVEDSVPEGGVEITNSFKKAEYDGPCPPIGSSHRYFFKVYALDSKLEPQTISNKKSLLIAMKEHVLASGELVGMYSR